MDIRTTPALALALALGTTLISGNAAADNGFGRGQAPAHLEGTWRVRTTAYVCGSDPIVSFPQFAVDSLVTFGAGGTLLEANSNARFEPGQRSAGHGYWERTGRSTYLAVLEAFIQFTGAPPSRYVRGTQRFDQEIELSDADNWTSSAAVTFFDVDGNKVPPSGCATAVGARLQ